jgi:pyridoxal phosphate enzyme (YggS family)
MAIKALEEIKGKINKAALRFGDTPLQKHAPQLIAVSKTFDEEVIAPFLEAGHRVFGENRVQESQKKWPGLKQKYNDIELHLIGPLQTNKIKDAVDLFDVIQTVDREKLARGLAKEFDRVGKSSPVFIQVNIGMEPQKAGIDPQETTKFVALCRDELGLAVEGLMCIPPADKPAAPYFAQMKELADLCGLEKLSMGMSADFEMAVEMGATHVRVGSALFGARDYA